MNLVKSESIAFVILNHSSKAVEKWSLILTIVNKELIQLKINFNEYTQINLYSK